MKSAKGALVATQDARHQQKGVLSLADTIFVIFPAKVAYASCARRAAVVEKREKRGKSMKSIRSHERSKQRRDEKETRRRKSSKAERRERKEEARARERDREGFVMLPGIRVHTHVASARTNTRIHTATHGACTRSRVSFPLKIREAIGSPSCSIILLLYLLRSVAPCAFPTLKDVTSCNADQRGRESERGDRAAGEADFSSLVAQPPGL